MPRLHLLSILCCCAFAAAAVAAPPESPRKIAWELGAGERDRIELAGRDAFRQLIVRGDFADGSSRDLTREVKWGIEPKGIVEIDPSGLVTPLAEGTARITATGPGGTSATLEVQVTHLVADLQVSFPQQVVPLFTKFGCNGGGCHGKSEGQNGFKLSLLGFEPREDFEYLVKEARGRRLFPLAPDHSLLLRKAAAIAPHGGGKRIDLDSPYYRLLRRWIEQGAPYGDPNAAAVERIEMVPAERVLARGQSQQLAVIAHLTDGRQMDVTRFVQFEPNQPELASASVTGLVTVGQSPGIVAVMARYQSHVSVFRGMIPLGAPVAGLPKAKNFVDEHVDRQLVRLGLPPSPACDDATFLRRATIDIAGRIPTSQEVEEFLADQSADKHDRLVDRLLASDDYADYFANKWSAVLRNRRKNDKEDPAPTADFHAWIRESLKDNRPFDRFAREVITAQGEAGQAATVAWYREVKDASSQLEDVSQLFLGQRIQCAKCHHHPFERWSQADYYSMAAFFSTVVVKEPPPKKQPKKGETPPPVEPFKVSWKETRPVAVHPKSGEKLAPAGLGSGPLALDGKSDPREHLADWMADPKNPFFARTLANRYWKHFLGRGLVEPEDDLRVTNPATNPELLDALAAHFVDSKFDLKSLVRVICTSNAYRRSSAANEHNGDDRQNYSRFLPRRLQAEVLLDAIDAATMTKTNFKNAPKELRAVQLPDNQFESYFLSVFGRPERMTACECERSSDLTLAQILHLQNSTDILAKVSGPRAQALGKDKRPHEERIRDLYIAVLSRPATEKETGAMLGHIERKKTAVQSAYEDMLWALINSKEFLMNR